MPSGRGSSSSSSVLTEAIRADTASAAIVLAEPDPILVVGALVALALYGHSCPVLVVGAEAFACIAVAETARVSAAGAVGQVIID